MLTSSHRTIASLVMKDLESRRESIERRRILNMARAIDQFIDEDTGELGSRHRSTSESYAPHVAELVDLKSPSSQPQPALPSMPNRDFVSSEKLPSAEKKHSLEDTKEANIVVSKANSTADDGTIDSKDKRDRDLVYARASYLIRKGLSMQGW
jgi:hypothetical protein